MRRKFIYASIVMVAFVAGTVTTTVWNSYFASLQSSREQAIEELEPALTNDLVRSALQTHGFLSREVQKNSQHDIEWRWLTKAIAAYPQNTVDVLDVMDKKGYLVKMYSPIILDDMQFDWYNEKLKREGLPPLHRNTRYLPINLFPGDNVCPYWGGLIDLDELRLAYFADRALLVTQYPTFGFNCRNSRTGLLAKNGLSAAAE